MRPLSKSVSVALLVGCLGVAVAAAGERVQERLGNYPSVEAMLKPFNCHRHYNKRTLTPEELATVLRNHQAWLESDRKQDDERRATLCLANLQGTDLREVNLQEANLTWAELQGADLREANLQKAALNFTKFQKADLREANLAEAFLFGASLQEAKLQGADLQGAALARANLQKVNLFGANLQGAFLIAANLQRTKLFEANLDGAHLFGANLEEAVYEPNPEKLPSLWFATTPHTNLEKLIFHTAPAALIALREGFKKAGMRTQERQITYAIEHTRRLRAWTPWSYIPIEDPRPWLEKLAGKSESTFYLLMFEFPCAYGMAPGRALWGLLGFIPVFALVYWLILQRTKSSNALWMIVPADRIAAGRGKEKIVRISRHPAKTWREFLRGESRLCCTSFYFSLLSAFHLGWRELNVGTWIARMQPREYTLRATGWVRTVSGVQSLLSVYLLALWVLTYFGRPFE